MPSAWEALGWLSEWTNELTMMDSHLWLLPVISASCIHTFVESPPLWYKGFASLRCRMWQRWWNVTYETSSPLVHTPSLVFSLALIEQAILSCPLEKPTEQGTKNVLLPIASESSSPPEMKPSQPPCGWAGKVDLSDTESWHDCSVGQHLIVACERPLFTQMFEL